MQHEMMRQPAPVQGSEKVGDVLASIRRLIAQDETPSPPIPNQMLNTLPRGTTAETDGIMADIAPEAGALADAWMQEAAPDLEQPDTALAEPLPLVLNTSDLIAPGFPDTDAEMPVEAELAPEPAPDMELESEPELGPEPWPAPLAASDDTQVEAAIETPFAMTSDPLPEAIAPDEPMITLSPASPPRFEFNLDALWADLPETDSPVSGLTHADSAGPESPGLTTSELTMPDLTTDDTAPYSLNLMQPEENMLQANASVTPINPNIDPAIHAEIETLRDGGEPHLFAPQDKGAQKGTHLRGMIREAIRQELQGEIGNRLSRNLQQMIRHEIELTLRQMCEQE